MSLLEDLALTDPPRKNDALLLYGLTQALPYVHCYEQDRVEVVHGPACRPETEINLDACRADGVAVVARRGGGGTVVLAPGMVVTVVVAPRPQGDVKAIYRAVQVAMVAVIASVGVSLHQQGISDLALGDQKVGGSSLYLPRRPNVFFYQSSLMVENNNALIERYLRHPPREPGYRHGRPHDDFCTNLRDEGLRMSAAQLAELLNGKLAKKLG